MPTHFTKRMTTTPPEVADDEHRLCLRIMVRVVNSRLTPYKEWALFVIAHQLKIEYLVTFKVLTPNSFKVIIFNIDDVEMVAKCKKHEYAFALDCLDVFFSTT